MKLSPVIGTVLTCGVLAAAVPIEDATPEPLANLTIQAETTEHRYRREILDTTIIEQPPSDTNQVVCYSRDMGLWHDYVLFVGGKYVAGDYGKNLEQRIDDSCNGIVRWEFDYGNHQQFNYDNWKNSGGKHLQYTNKSGDARASFRVLLARNDKCVMEALAEASADRGGDLVWMPTWLTEEDQMKHTQVDACRKVPWSLWRKWPLWRYRNGS